MSAWGWASGRPAGVLRDKEFARAQSAVRAYHTDEVISMGGATSFYGDPPSAKSQPVRRRSLSTHAEPTGVARWPVERCLQEEKSEFGMSHFEVRKYPSICRQLILTTVSHLFLPRQMQRLRREKSEHHHLPSTRCRRRPDRHATPPPKRPFEPIEVGGGDRRPPPETQRCHATISHRNKKEEPPTTRHRPGRTAML